MSADIKLSKAQIFKIIQSGGFLGSLLSKLAGPLISSCSFSKTCFSSIRNNSSCFSIRCRNSEKNTWIWDNNFNNFQWRNEWYNVKIIKSLEDSNILLKGVTKTIKNETKEQKGGFLSMLLGTLGASLLGNLLSGKGIKADSEDKKGKWIVRDSYGNKIDF